MPSVQMLIVAGEASGDLHGAHLIRALKARLPHIQCYGVGGAHLRQEGVTLLSSSDELGVVGVSEVLKKLGAVYRVYRTLCRFLTEQRPDVVILVDYPDFNLRLARVARKLGIPIIYYISPQVWAWRSGRVKLIRRLVSKMLVIFPFEQEFYHRHGVEVEWVGHPFVETVKSSLTKAEFCQQYGLDPAQPILGLLPGSRESEVQRLLPVMLEATRRIHQQQPDVQIILPIAPSLQSSGLFSQDIPAYCHLIRQQTYDAIHAADLIITASGTATVEAALLETPMIIAYIVAPLTYWLGRLFIHVPFIGMVNLIAGKQVVPELIQTMATPERIAQEVLTFLHHPEKLVAMKQDLRLVRQKLGDSGAPDRAAATILNVLDNAHETRATTRKKK